MLCVYVFFFNDTATTEIYTYGHTLSLHDALPILWQAQAVVRARSSWLRPFCVRLGEMARRIVRRREVMPDFRRDPAAVVGAHAIMDILIVPGRALVLAQVLRPARNEEPFDPDAGFGRVLRDAPVVRAIPVAFV